MRVAFCVYGYLPETERLQPWLTVHEVAKVLLASGWQVHLITDVAQPPTLTDVQHHCVRTLRPSNRDEVRTVLEGIGPDRVVVLATPLNLATSGWYRYVRCPLVAFLSYPFYTPGEVLRAVRHLRGSDLLTYGRHLLVPRLLWARTLKNHFAMVIAQSRRTSSRVASAAGAGVAPHALRAGLDLDFWSPEDGEQRAGGGKVRFLYVGSAKAIRGFDVLLRAFKRLRDARAELRILARGSTADEVAGLRQRVERRLGAMAAQVEIVGGWMERERYRQEIRSADVTVLPFVLVPSELPVSVIECIACGTPVIATDIDGLPDAVGDAGVIVRSGSTRALATAMGELARSSERRMELRRRCVEARTRMLDWPSVGREWLQVLAS